MNLRKVCLLLLLSVPFCGKEAHAQNWEIGLGAGAAGYIGDLNPNNPIKFSGVSAGGFIKLSLDPYWSIGLHYTYGRIEADDAQSNNEDFQQRNLKFYTPLHEVSALVDFNFLEYFSGGGRKRFTPYIYAGIGGVIFNPKRVYNDEIRYLRLYRTEDQVFPYKNYAVTIPYGAGLKFKLKSNFSIFSQLGYRTAYTDYLDDISGVYKRITDGNPIRKFLANPALDGRAEGAQRGDSGKRDTYMFVQTGIAYTFLCKDCGSF